jgi:integrase
MKERREENNLKFVKGSESKPGYYLTDVTLNYVRVRRFAGYTKEEAKTYLAELRIAARAGKLTEKIRPQKPADTFGDYAQALLDSAEWKAKRSASRNEISLKHLNLAFKDKRLAEINPGLVRKYVTDRRDKGLSPATINREISLLKSILYSAEYDGLIASNPIRGRRVKKLEEAGSREKVILSMGLTDDKLLELIEGAAPHFKPILELALVTGMRRGEIFKMKWKDVNFTLKRIRIPAENAKSKQERIVPIDAETAMDLDSIERKSDYVFMNDWTGKGRKDVREAFRAACERVGIPTGRGQGLVFHDLRHLAAYRLVKATDIVTASKILGHASIQMTMRYCHSEPRDVQAAVDKVAENLYRGRQNPVNGMEPQAQEGLEKRALIN